MVLIHPGKNGASECVPSVNSIQTVLLLNHSTSLGPGSWAFCHILSLPTRPPAAHQEKEIRTIPSCHCPTTRPREKEGFYTHKKHISLYTGYFENENE